MNKNVKCVDGLFSWITEILVCLFCVGMIFAPSLWKFIPIVAAGLWIFAKIFKVSTAVVPQLKKTDWIFIALICVSWFLLFIASGIQLIYGLSDEVFIFRDLKNALRVVVAIFVFCCFSKRAFPVCLFLTILGLTIAAGTEYFLTGTRVSLGVNQNSLSAAGVWLLFCSLYFCESLRISKYLRWLSFFAAIFSTSIIALGGSRAAFVAGIIGLVFYVSCTLFSKEIWWKIKERGLRFVVIVFVLSAVSFLPSLSLNRIVQSVPTDFTQESVNTFSNYRVDIWKSTWKGIHDSNWLCGMGGKVQEFSQLPAYQNIPVEGRIPHNTFLALWLKFGILGFAAAIIFHFSGIWKALHDIYYENDDRFICLGALMVSFLVFGLFDVPHWGNKYIFWSVMAILFFSPIMERSLNNKKLAGKENV